MTPQKKDFHKRRIYSLSVDLARAGQPKDKGRKGANSHSGLLITRRRLIN